MSLWLGVSGKGRWPSGLSTIGGRKVGTTGFLMVLTGRQGQCLDARGQESDRKRQGLRMLRKGTQARMGVQGRLPGVRRSVLSFAGSWWWQDDW